jgi:hypothetical protein
VVGCAVLGVAAVNFFGYPLDTELYIGAFLVQLAARALAVVAVIVAALIAWRHYGYPSAAVLCLIAVLALALVVRVDLEKGFPYAYFQLHRSDFAAAATFANRVPVGANGTGEAMLPTDQMLASGQINVEQRSDGSRTAVLWMSYASGEGYGYAYAPWAAPGMAVLSSPVDLVVVMALGDGWWWVSNLGRPRSESGT